MSDDLGESSSAMIDRMETGKTEYDTSHKQDIVSSESEDQTVGEESTYSVDWMVDVNDEAQYVPEKKAEGEDYGSDFDTFTENSQPVEKEPETIDEKADALTEQILSALVVMAGEDGKERVFPQRVVMMNAYKDKFPFKKIEYSQYKEKDGGKTDSQVVEDAMFSITDSLTQPYYIGRLLNNVRMMERDQ